MESASVLKAVGMSSVSKAFKKEWLTCYCNSNNFGLKIHRY